jgi:hypothetical protein
MNKRGFNCILCFECVYDKWFFSDSDIRLWLIVFWFHSNPSYVEKMQLPMEE